MASPVLKKAAHETSATGTQQQAQTSTASDPVGKMNHHDVTRKSHKQKTAPYTKVRRDTEQGASASNTSNPVCSICLESLVNRLEDRSVVAFTCIDVFHKSCIKEWAKQCVSRAKPLKCPMCRTQQPSEVLRRILTPEEIRTLREQNPLRGLLENDTSQNLLSPLLEDNNDDVMPDIPVPSPQDNAAPQASSSSFLQGLATAGFVAGVSLIGIGVFNHLMRSRNAREEN